MPSLKLFGGASLEGDAGGLTGPATHRHRLALLAVLAVAHPRGVARDNLMALLWPETDTPHARNLLNQAVYVLRKAFGEDALRTAGDKVQIDPTLAPSDVIAFKSAVAQGDFESAVALYAGPFLDGFFLPDAPDFDHWAEAERNRLRLAYCKTLTALATTAEKDGGPSEAIEWWRRLSSEDPYGAQVTISLMEALEGAGDRAGAIRQADVQAALLREDFGAVPHPDVVALAERIRLAPVPQHSSGDGEVVWNLRDATPPSASVSIESPAALEETRRTRHSPTVTGEGIAKPSAATHSGLENASTAWTAREEARAASPTAPRIGLPRFRRAAGGALVVLFGVLSFWVISRARHSGPEATSALAESRDGRTLIVVLPMQNLGPTDAGYFAAGMTEEIVTRLTAMPALGVISQKSAMPASGATPAQIGRGLGAAYVLDGSVRWAAGNEGYGRVRVTPHLIRVSDGTTLWSEAYERDMADVFAVQVEIAEAVAAHLGIQLGLDRGNPANPQSGGISPLLTGQILLFASA